MRRSFLAGFAKLMAAIRVIIGILLALSVLLNLANVVGRYIFRAPISGAEEVMLFFMVGIVFLGAAVVSWEGAHIRMDIVVSLMPRPAQRVLEVISDLAMMVACSAIIVLGAPVIRQLFAFNELSQAASVPLWIPQGLIPVGLFLVIIATIARLADPTHLYAPRHGPIDEMLNVPTAAD